MSKPQNTWDLGPRLPEVLKKSDYKSILRAQAEKRKRDYFYDLAVFDKKGQLVGGVSLMEVSRAISQSLDILPKPKMARICSFSFYR